MEIDRFPDITRKICSQEVAFLANIRKLPSASKKHSLIREKFDYSALKKRVVCTHAFNYYVRGSMFFRLDIQIGHDYIFIIQSLYFACHSIL